MAPASQPHQDDAFEQLIQWARGHDSSRAIPRAGVDEFSDYGERLGYKYPLELDESDRFCEENAASIGSTPLCAET